MKRVLMVAALVGMGVMVGCEEKKADSIADKAKQAAGAVGDKAKDAGNAVKDAAHSATDKAKDAAAGMKDAAAGMADKAKEAATGGVKNLMDTLKTKIDSLTKAGESLKADQKPEFAKAMSGITDQFSSLTKGFDSLKSMSGDGLMAKVKELTGGGEGLMKTISETAAKFGLKL